LWPPLRKLREVEPRTLACERCRNEPTPEAFIAGLTIWWSDLGVARHVCPVCGFVEDVQPEAGRILFGYIYAAATAHYAAMDEAVVEGLEVRSTAEGLRLTLGSTVVDVPKGAPAVARPQPRGASTGNTST
jgi:hypothetical protein